LNEMASFEIAVIGSVVSALQIRRCSGSNKAGERQGDCGSQESPYVRNAHAVIIVGDNCGEEARVSTMLEVAFLWRCASNH
jgi:hypothetical protein